MKQVPFDLGGLRQQEFAELTGLGASTITGWKKSGQMPFWASLIHVGPSARERELEAEVARLNLVVDELIKRLGR